MVTETGEGAMTQRRRVPVGRFFGIAFAWTWTFWWTVALTQLDGSLLFFTGGLGPLVGAAWVVGRSGRAYRRDFLSVALFALAAGLVEEPGWRGAALDMWQQRAPPRWLRRWGLGHLGPCGICRSTSSQAPTSTDSVLGPYGSGSPISCSSN